MVPYWWSRRKKSAAHCSRQAHGRLCHHVTQWHSAAPADVRQIFNQHASRQASAAQPLTWSPELQHMSNMLRISLPYRASLSLTSTVRLNSHTKVAIDSTSFQSSYKWVPTSCDNLLGSKTQNITNTTVAVVQMAACDRKSTGYTPFKSKGVGSV